MNNQRFIAFALIAIGIIAIASRFSGDAGWLWVGLVAAGFLAAYSRQRTYSFLVVGSILTGVAVGILLEGNWGWNGAFLISLGIGFFAIDQVERRSNRWPRALGVVLVGLGLFSGLVDSGLFGSVWFAIALIVGGAYLLSRGNNWVQFPPARQPVTDPPTPAPEPPAAEVATAAEPADEAESEEADEPVDDASPGEAPVVQRRLERLQAWRREAAESEERAAYLILNNQTLQSIAEVNPGNLEDLRAIRGIGPVKLERYGEELLEVLAAD